MPFQHLLEGEGHAAADDDLVGLLEEVVDERDLVGDLGPAQDGEQRPLRALHHRVEGVELRLHQEASRLVGKGHPDHRAVGAVRGAEGVVDVDVAEPGQALAERLHRGRIGRLLGAVLELHLRLLLDVEAEVLEQHHLARLQGALRAGRFHRRPHAVGEERDLLAQDLGELVGNRLQGELRHHLPVGPAQMRHEHDRGALLERVLDGGERGQDALVVGDGAGHLVLRDVEVHPHQDALPGER